MLGSLDSWTGQNSSHLTVPCLLSSGSLIQIPKVSTGLGDPERDGNGQVLEISCTWEGNESRAFARLRSLYSAQRRPPDWGAGEEGCGGLHAGPDPLRLEMNPGIQVHQGLGSLHMDTGMEVRVWDHSFCLHISISSLKGTHSMTTRSPEAWTIRLEGDLFHPMELGVLHSQKPFGSQL